jgi:hypothetical protein
MKLWLRALMKTMTTINLMVGVLLLATTCFAQRGQGILLPALAPAPVVSLAAPALSAVAPPANKTNLFYNLGLTWDAPASVVTSYRIRYGTNSAAAFLTNTVNTTNTFCTVSNLAFKPTWYFQAHSLAGTNISEGSNILPVQPPLEGVFVLSTIFPLYTSTNNVNWITNKIVTLVQTNPPGMSFFRSHMKQLDYQWTNNQMALKPFAIP